MKGFSKRGWARVDVTGDDGEIVSELVSRRLGVAHTSRSEIEVFGTYTGLVANTTANTLEIDLGLEIPKPETVKVKLSTLRAQLCDGRAMAMKDLVDNYCLFHGSKVDIRTTSLTPEIEGWLADSQIDTYSDWISMRLDRILVFESSEREVDLAIRRANLGRDIIAVDHITLTTHSALCKSGTDAVGLLPKLGWYLRNRELKPFIPRRILSRCRQW